MHLQGPPGRDGRDGLPGRDGVTITGMAGRDGQKGEKGDTVGKSLSPRQVSLNKLLNVHCMCIACVLHVL